MKKLKSGGKAVFLDVPLEEIERRIKQYHNARYCNAAWRNA